MEYKIKDVCNALNLGVSKFYRLKGNLDNSIPEQNRIEYYYNKGRSFYITEKGLDWFKNNLTNSSKSNTSYNDGTSSITVYQNQIIEMYKKENEYLKQENQRLLDVIALKEKKELAKDIHRLDDNTSSNTEVSFFRRFFGKKHI